MELELKSNQNPQVRLNYYGGTVTLNGVTTVSPTGALVQMFMPFKLSDAKQLSNTMYLAPYGAVRQRAATILGLSLEDLDLVVRYLYRGELALEDVVTALRSLK